MLTDGVAQVTADRSAVLVARQSAAVTKLAAATTTDGVAQVAADRSAASVAGRLAAATLTDGVAQVTADRSAADSAFRLLISPLDTLEMAACRLSIPYFPRADLRLYTRTIICRKKQGTIASTFS